MTRLLLIGAAVLGGFGVSVQAAEKPTTQPSKPTVLVLPFTSPADSGATWVGRAVKDDLVASLKRDLDAKVKTPSVDRNIGDSAAAIELAHQYRASIVIYGYVQESDTIARVTGQVIDVDSGMPIGVLKVTGPATSILDIDDALVTQALVSMPPALLKPEAIAMLQQRSIPPVGPEIDEPPMDGVAMVSQSYPMGSMTFIPTFTEEASPPYSQNISYIYAPTIIVSAGYGYGGAYAPDYYGPPYAYPSPIFVTPHRHDHLPVIHHGPQRPGTFRGSDAGIVIAGSNVAGDSSSTFTFGQSVGAVNTPFMGGGQSFPVQNGFVTSGASAGFSVFTGPRFSNTPNLLHGGGYSGGRAGR